MLVLFLRASYTYLAEKITNMKRITTILFAMALLFFTFEEVDAQRSLRNYELAEMSVDTVTDTGTTNFIYPKAVEGKYDLAWQTRIRNVSGTTAGTATLQYTLDRAGVGPWHTAESWTFSGANDTLWVVQNVPAARVRVQYVGTGTQVSAVDNLIRWVARKD